MRVLRGLGSVFVPKGGCGLNRTVDRVEREEGKERAFFVLLILDEVMSGGGRTGRFFAAEHWDVVPDIIAISKGFGAGYVPLGAMIAQERLVKAVLDAGGFIHGYTYAGNPLACAAGLAVLQEIERGDLMSNASNIGAKLAEKLNTLRDVCPLIGDVRGMGLLLAFELVADTQTMKPLPASIKAFDRLVEIAYGRGLIIYSRRTRGGREGDHFLVCPPMITTEDQVDEIIMLLRASLKDFMNSVASELKDHGIKVS